MLTAMIRRLVLTSLIVTAFAGAGMLFGEAQSQTMSVVRVAEINLDVEQPTLAGADLGLAVSAPSTRKANAAFNWPFFSFRKGSR